MDLYRALRMVDYCERCGCTGLPVGVQDLWWQTEKHLQFLSSPPHQFPTEQKGRKRRKLDLKKNLKQTTQHEELHQPTLLNNKSYIYSNFINTMRDH